MEIGVILAVGKVIREYPGHLSQDPQTSDVCPPLENLVYFAPIGQAPRAKGLEWAIAHFNSDMLFLGRQKHHVQ
jgi:hypothetical protein